MNGRQFFFTNNLGIPVPSNPQSYPATVGLPVQVMNNESNFHIGKRCYLSTPYNLFHIGILQYYPKIM